MLEFTITLIASLATLPVVEYLSHRLFMHHPTPIAAAVYDRHAIQHHRLGRLDLNIDLEPWYAVMLLAPILLSLGLLHLWVATLTIVVIAGLYSILWTGLHRSIHGLGGRWTTRLPFYAAIHQHHLGHHARPGRNFGTVFGPLLDRPLGTWTDSPLRKEPHGSLAVRPR